MSEKKSDRRGFLKQSAAASAAAAAALTLEGRGLLGRTPDSPAAPTAGGAALRRGKIGAVEISRLICGGNLISGFAHSRNLAYVSDLMRHYFTDDKIVETFETCESNGINTVITIIDKKTTRVLERHRKNGGKIQWLAQMHTNIDDPLAQVKLAIDNGAVGAFVQGAYSDRMVRSAKGLEALKTVVAHLQTKKLIAGVGGHTLNSPMTCEKEGVGADFYFKTLNDVKYHSATPEKTIEFMKTVARPWIAFKVLGAGVVNPTKGFKHALQGGADFLCVGMFDFQVADDVQIVKGILARGVKRDRPWRA